MSKRSRHGNGQLAPLDRSIKREIKIEARKTIAQQLHSEIHHVGQFAAGFIFRGFWARLKWLLFGEPFPKTVREALQRQGVSDRPVTQGKSALTIRKLAEGE